MELVVMSWPQLGWGVSRLVRSFCCPFAIASGVGVLQAWHEHAAVPIGKLSGKVNSGETTLALMRYKEDPSAEQALQNRHYHVAVFRAESYMAKSGSGRNDFWLL